MGDEARSADGAVTTSRDGAVLHITLDRISHRNSLSHSMIDTLVEVLVAAATDDALRAVHLRGAGTDFCAGVDWVGTNSGGRRPRTGDLVRRIPHTAHRVIELVHTLHLPVVCTVRGWAVGLGCNLALAADFTVAAHDAVFWEPFVDRGFSPDSGSTWLLPRLVGMARAKRMLLLGEKVDGATAAQWGLIHRSVDAAELDAAVTGAARPLGVGARRWRSVWPSRRSTTASTPPCNQAMNAGTVQPRTVLPDNGFQGRSGRVPGATRTRLHRAMRRRDPDMTTVSYDTITYEVDGHTATITLNRPEALNALSPYMITELRAAYDDAENDDDIWLLIVTATGRAFCTGADVKEIPEDGKVINERAYLSTYDQWEAPQEGTPPFRRMAKPVLVAINGICCGAGLDWVTTGDIVIASDKATFFDPHVTIGLVAGREMVRLARVLPRSVALRMAMMGKHERMSAERAYELGMITEVVAARPAARTGARDRRHREPQCAAGGSRHPAGHPQDPRHTAARGRDPGRGVPGAQPAHRGLRSRGRRRSSRSAHRTGSADDRRVRDHPARLRPRPTTSPPSR